MKIWYLDSIEYDEFIMFTFYFGSKLSWANLAQKTKIIYLKGNLVPRLIRIC